MSAITKNIEQLSPEEQRALLGELLRKKASEPKVFQASFSQERMWLLDQLQPGTAVYNIPSAFRITVPISIPALERTLNEIVRRHEALRTTFDSRGGEVVQLVSPSLTLPLPITDLSHLPFEEREREAQRLTLEEAQRPFDLSTGPLLRASVLRMGPTDLLLLLTMHHIVSDGWSLGIFFRELGVLYQALAMGQSSPLPELPVQYADFAHWQRERLRGEALENHVSYWREQLAGAPSLLELPSDKPRPQVQSFRGAVHPLAISQTVMRSLRAVGQREGATLFMALLAGLKALLYRYSGQSDLVVGSAIANRTRPELENLIGFFTNTLVLRTQVTGELSFRKLLRRVRDVTVGAYAHQDLPFEKLVEELQPERNLNRNPLFQVAFTFQHAAVGQNSTTSSQTESQPASDNPEVFTATSKFDLTLSLVETDTGLNGAWEYSTDLFEAGTMSRMADHLRILLASAVANPDMPLSKLPMLTEAELEQLLVQWNTPMVECSDHSTLHQLFEQQAARTPHAVAVEGEGEQLTYTQLNERANKLARYLRAMGMNSEHRVGICLERSLEMVVSVLAVLKSGASYVPLDPIYPPERLNWMIDDAAVGVLLTQRELADGITEGRSLSKVYLDSQPEEIGKQSAANGDWEVNETALAYLIYTSGSTGKPKGVTISHQNVVRLFRSTEHWFNFNGRDVWTLFHSYAFDFSVWEIWGALLHGGKLVLVPYWISRTPEEFYDLLVKHKVTVLNQTPSAFRQLVSLEKAGTRSGNLSLRLVIFGGEALDIQSLRPWFERHGDQHPQLVNMYGITETTVHVSYRPLTAKDVQTPSGSMIGRPIPDLQVYLLDKHLQPVPIGIPGEIYVGGAGVSLGYWNQASMTAERFIPSPFNPTSRLYKTGDLARYRPNGDIEYIGRTDQQVKIRGFRIELGEIESVLKQHPGIQEAVVLSREVLTDDKRLTAYVVPDHRQANTVRQLLRMKREGRLTDKLLHELRNGMVVVHKNKSETDFMFQEIFEELTYFQNGITLDDGACIFDVGANIGLFTLFTSRVCKNATVYAFEPIPPIFDVLRANVELYGLSVKLFNHGISNEAKTVPFTYYPHVSAVSGVYGDKFEQREVIRSFLINQERLSDSNAALPGKKLLDELLEERLTSERFLCQLKTISGVIRENSISRIDLLKLDVEKSELDVLAGIEPGDWAKITQFVVEVHDDDNRVEKITALFKDHGYEVITKQDAMLADTGLYNIYAVQRSAQKNRSAAPIEIQDESSSTWNSESVLSDDVRNFLVSKLPDYMLPADYVLLEQLPLTANGKLDLQALPVPDVARAQAESNFVAPRNKTEEILARIWSEVLAVEKVGVNENFFELGGHSLLATQALSRMHDLFHLDLHLRTLFESPTIEQLAAVIAQLQSSRPEASRGSIPRISREQHRVKLPSIV